MHGPIIPGEVLDGHGHCRDKIADLERENVALRGVLEKWKTWCELNRREGSKLYQPTCEVLAKARNP